MTQSGQGEESGQRHAREGIVLPSDGGAPLMPGSTSGPGPHHGPQPGSYGGARSDAPSGHPGGQQGPYTGRQPAPQQPAASPAGGQAWGTPWGPGRQQPGEDPQAGRSWPPAAAQQWGTSDAWTAQPLPSESPAPQPYAQPEPASYAPQQPTGGAPLPPAAPASYGSAGTYGGSPLPPAADEGATQYLPPVAAPGADGATQYIPPVPAGPHEGATQYIPPVGPGALPPEAHGAAPSDATQFLGGPRPGGGPMPPAAGPDAQPTQYLPPVTDQAPGAPYGERQPPAEFDNLFRSAPGGEGPAAATQQLPRVDQQQPSYGAAQQPSYAQPQTSYFPPGRDDDGRGGGRGGRPRSRVPLIAAVGIGIVVLGVGAGALLGGGGGDDSKDRNQTVSATAPATEGSASPSADPAKTQAVALDKLLADSGNSRASVIAAVADVKRCANLTQAASDLRAAAKQRTELVTRLSGLSVDRLPNHADLTSSLTKAWQASAAADNHYAAWADQVAGNKKGCKKGQARTTGQTAAGNRESGTASQQKARAAGLWNAIAKTYGLTQRQPTQL
ncbi:hypothetical protein ACYF6T_11005 [Streptomyces sp. 7R007]